MNHIDPREIHKTELTFLLSAHTQIKFDEATLYIDFKWQKTDQNHQLLMHIRSIWNDFGSHQMNFACSEDALRRAIVPHIRLLRVY